MVQEVTEAKPRLKSKTNWVALLIGIFGILQTNIPMLQDMLGKYYGVSYMVIAVVMFALREVTTGPVK